MMFARRLRSACTFLGVLFLVLSQTQMIVRAQQTMINVSPATNSINATSSTVSAQALAKVLTTIFSDIGQDLNTLGSNVTMRNGTVLSALRSAMTQEQSLGSLQTAADAITALLTTPTTFGTGQNIKNFLKQVQQFKSLADSLNGQLDGTRIRQIRGYLDRAKQLALQAITAGPLAQLVYSTAQVALASAILFLLASIFFIVGASLGLAANTGGLAAVSAANPGKSSVADSQWFKDITSKASALQTPVLSVAFSNQTLSMLTLADGMLGVAQAGLSLVPTSTSLI